LGLKTLVIDGIFVNIVLTMELASITLSLVQNTAVLLSFSMLYDFFWIGEEAQKRWYHKVLAGVVVGGIGLVLMLMPWTLSPGVVFDTRSVLLSITGLYFGWIPTLTAMVIDVAYRIYLGGPGTWMGVAVIVSSGFIGLAWRYLRPGWTRRNHWRELLALGVCVHLAMLGCTVFLPTDKFLPVVSHIALPLMLIYAPGTMLLGLFMYSRGENWLNKKALKETKLLYSSLVENMPAAVFRKTRDGRYDYVNQLFCDLKGLSEQEILGRTPFELAEYESHKAISSTKYKPRQRTMAREGTDHHQWILEHGRPIRVEEVYTLPDGSVEIFQVVKTPIFDTTGSVIGSQGMLFDISSQKRVEEALLNEQYMLNSFLNNTPDRIYFKDLNSRFTRVNRAHAQLFGLSVSKDAIGKSDFDFFSEEHARKAYEDEQKIIETGLPMIGIEEKETWEDGSVSWASSSKFPLIDVDGKVIGTFGVSRDITLQKQLAADLLSAKEKAEEGDHLKTAFLHNISHEIRTPMNAIVGFSSFLTDPALSEDKRAHYAQIVIQSSNQLLSIIDDIVRIATIEAGQEKIHESQIRINELCRLLLEQFSTQASSKGLDLKFLPTLPDDRAMLQSDEIKFTQVLSNLLVNAFKFTKQGYIHFGYELKDGVLEFYVEDTGIGIPEEMHGEIFKRFRQVESTLSRQFGGSGLGLSICQAYIELMGGRMWVQSEYGKGSVFRFTIPYQIPGVSKAFKVSSLTEPVGPEFSGEAPMLLVAEDEEFNFMLLREILTPFHCRIIRVVNGQEAVDKVRETPDIDLVLMDLKMPVMDGYEATRKIKAFRPFLPVIALTAYSHDSDRHKAFTAGCDDFVSKPFNKAELMGKIRAKLRPAENRAAD
jgi:PAS domain S-box-containing protein